MLHEIKCMYSNACRCVGAGGFGLIRLNDMSLVSDIDRGHVSGCCAGSQRRVGHVYDSDLDSMKFDDCESASVFIK